MTIGDKVRIKIGRGTFVGTVASVDGDRVGVSVRILYLDRVVVRAAAKVEKIEEAQEAAA
jgi:hypothetical protein